MTLVSFLEYEPIQVLSELQTLEDRAITIGELDYLDKLSARLKIQLVEHVSRSQVRPKQYVGTIQLPSRTLEFLPKVERSESNNLPRVRHNLLEMLLVANDLDGNTSGKVALATRSFGWLDLLILLFCSALADQVRKGLVNRYRIDQDDLSTVKGRILIEEQIRRNLIHKERIACEYDEFDENHGLNQLLKLTLRMMLRVASNASTEQAVRGLLPTFENVSDVTLTKHWLEAIKIDRMSERFDFCTSLAKLFLNGMTTDMYSGKQASFALIFDMPKLFERYIGKQMRRALRPLGHDVMVQDSRHFLARDSKTNLCLFQLRPDIVVNTAGTTTCIVDTKWKQLRPDERKLGVSQADLYQMFAYAERYQCKSILLLYPWGQWAADFRGIHKQLIFEATVSTVTVGEISLADLATVPDQLYELFDRSVTIK